jgi:hypothetical protein
MHRLSFFFSAQAVLTLLAPLWLLAFAAQNSSWLHDDFLFLFLDSIFIFYSLSLSLSTQFYYDFLSLFFLGASDTQRTNCCVGESL